MTLPNLSNAEIVQLIGKGYKVHEIAKETGLSRFYLAKRINDMRERCLCKTVAQLVLVYRNKNLIE